MLLTPIKVRGKNRKPTTTGVSELRGRGRPLKPQTNLSASNTDVEIESRLGGDGKPKKRRKTRHTRTLAPLESLPTEILQSIFFLSRNADLMFASKAVMHKLENSEHVKIEFCFGTLFWPIINGEVDSDLNNRPDPRVSSGDEENDEDNEEGALLGHAQSRLLSCRFFTRHFFYTYLVKAYRMWNDLYASSHPERVVEMPKFQWAPQIPLAFTPRDKDYISVCALPLTRTRTFGTRATDEEAKKFRTRLEPTAFHPSALIPGKLFYPSAYDMKSYLNHEPNHFGGHTQYEILGFLRRGLCMRMPVTGDRFDNLVRDVARTGNQYLMRAMLWFRVWEPTVDTRLPSDLLRVLVLEANCPKGIVEDILSLRAHEKALLSQNDLLDPTVWAWAEKNGEDGEWLKQKMKERLNVP